MMPRLTFRQQRSPHRTNRASRPAHQRRPPRERPQTYSAPEPLRSNRGTIPGSEFPGAVYGSIVLTYGLMLIAVWLFFGRAAELSLDLGVVTALFTIMLALPIIMIKTAKSWTRG